MVRISIKGDLARRVQRIVGIIRSEIPRLSAEERVVKLRMQFKEVFILSAYEFILFVYIPQFSP